ncbi:MAG: hypothetical protein P4L76_04275 [Beijerinckiaceae bacterium]|nr:hypothetical protein [Beijerinckiaceae bacterium]
MSNRRIKYRVPPGCAAICHGGTVYEISIDRTIEAGEADAPSLAAHGLVPIDLVAPVRHPVSLGFSSYQINKMTRDELIAAHGDCGVRGPLPRHLAALRSSLRRLVSAANAKMK